MNYDAGRSSARSGVPSDPLTGLEVDPILIMMGMPSQRACTPGIAMLYPRLYLGAGPLDDRTLIKIIAMATISSAMQAMIDAV